MNADPAQMNVPTEELGRERERLSAISARVIGAAQKVSSTLGCGFAEKVYETNMRLGLLLNFGRAHLEVGRVVFHF